MAGFFRRMLGGRRASTAADRVAEPAATGTTAGNSTVTEPTTGRPTAAAPPRAATSPAPPSPAPTSSRTAEPTPSGPVPGRAAGDAPTRLLIFGQVRQGGGSPLAGATVTLTDLSGRQLDRDSADAGGHYRLSPPAGGSYLVICALEAYQPTAALVAVAQEPVRHDVLLSGAGASMSGVVVLAESGEPMAGAVVTLVDLQGDVVGAVGTDEQGRFGFAELGAGHYTLTVAAESLQPVARGLQVPAEGHVSVQVEVAARVSLAGMVRAATSGLPVPEALATLIAADGQVVGSAITDAGGRFVFDDLPVGPYTLIATGYPPVAAEVMVGMGADTETVITLWPPSLESPLATTTSTSAVNNTGWEDDDGH